MANGQLVRFPVVFHFRYIGTREIHGITYLPVGTMQRHDAYLMTEVRLWRTVFLPIKTTCGNIAAKQF